MDTSKPCCLLLRNQPLGLINCADFKGEWELNGDTEGENSRQDVPITVIHQELCLELLRQDCTALTHYKIPFNSLYFIVLELPKFEVRNSHSPALGTAEFWGLFDFKFWLFCSRCINTEHVLDALPRMDRFPYKRLFLAFTLGNNPKDRLCPSFCHWEITAGGGCECEDEIPLL